MAGRAPARGRRLPTRGEFLAGYPHASLVERRLSPALMPHLDGETFAAFRVAEAERTEAQKQSIALSDTLIAAHALARPPATVREGAIWERTALHQSLSGVAVFFVVLY